MSSHLFLIGLDLIGTGLLVALAYKLGVGIKSRFVQALLEAKDELKVCQEHRDKLKWVNSLLTEALTLQVEEEKECDHCLSPKPLTEYHSHPTCKICRREEDAARYKAKKEVAL